MKNYSYKTKIFALFLLFTFSIQIFSQSSEIRFPVKRQETPETWRRGGLVGNRNVQKIWTLKSEKQRT